MKILYIGHYRNGLNDGWARCSKDQILALNSAGLDVCIRPVILNNNEIPEELKEFEEKSSYGYDLCIQHLLPHCMEKSGKCIGSFVCDSSSIIYSGWPARLKQMDDVWVPNNNMVKVCQEFGVTPKVVPHALNTTIYQSNKQLKLPYGFNFYTIADFGKRKNIIALLKAFHLEFKNEPVNLILKISKSGSSQDIISKDISEMSNKVKQSLKIHKNIESFKNEILITERLSHEQMCGLHNSCDAYICSSYEESWGYPVSDAMGFGKVVISNKVSGPSDYISHGEDGYLVNNMETPCFGVEGFRDVYTGYETWKDININELRFYMRKTFSENHSDMKEKAREKVKNFSYQKIGQLMRKLCENI